jgi:hypothetical protein
LLTQGEIFQDERLSMEEEAAQETSEQGHPGILAGVGKSNDFRRDGVFADYAFGKLQKKRQPSVVADVLRLRDQPPSDRPRLRRGP